MLTREAVGGLKHRREGIRSKSNKEPLVVSGGWTASFSGEVGESEEAGLCAEESGLGPSSPSSHWVWLPGPGCLEPGQGGQLRMSLGSCWMAPCSSGEGFHPTLLCPLLRALCCPACQHTLLPSLRPLPHNRPPLLGPAHPLAFANYVASLFLIPFLGPLPSHTPSPLRHKFPLFTALRIQVSPWKPQALCLKVPASYSSTISRKPEPPSGEEQGKGQSG